MTISSILEGLPPRPCDAAGTAPADCGSEVLLTAAAARGDADSFRILVETWSPALLRFCLRTVRCPEDARDICQETFVRAWGALQTGYIERGRFRAWLWRIALNLCRDHCRAGRVRIRAEALLQEMQGADAIPPPRSPAEQADHAADVARLADGLNALPESLRLPLWLCSVEELSQAECAAALGISIRAVEGRIHRARRRLSAWWTRTPVR